MIFLISVSSIMSFVMSYTKIPQLLADTLAGFTDNKVSASPTTRCSC